MDNDNPLPETFGGDDPDAVLDRLAMAFGKEPIDDMAIRFADGLHDALRKLDTGDLTSAHRIAGIAGTLGFAAVGCAWLDVAEGRTTTTEAVRLESDRALTILARRA